MNNINFIPKPLSISNSSLNIYYQNVRGLHTKLFNLLTNFVLHSYDVYILTETWISGNVSDAELGFDGFVIFRCDRNVLVNTLVIFGMAEAL